MTCLRVMGARWGWDSNSGLYGNLNCRQFLSLEEKSSSWGPREDVRLLGGCFALVAARGGGPGPPFQPADPLRGEGEVSILFAQRKATASSGCRGVIFSASDSEIGTCTLEFHFLKGERPRFCSLPHLPKSGKMQPGEEGRRKRGGI